MKSIIAKKTLKPKKPKKKPKKNPEKKIAPQLLTWFFQNRRDFPWRAPMGKRSNPYHALLSEIMLQQTTSQTVHDYFLTFIARYPRLQDLADAPLDEILLLWRGLGYYSRARNLHLTAQQIRDDYHGNIPHECDTLKQFKGIGDYTAAAIAAIAFNQPVMAIDGNIRRVASRLFRVETRMADKDYAHLFEGYLPEEGDTAYPQTRYGDMVQGLMELGSRICRPKNPHCGQCPLHDDCRGRDIAESLPKLAPAVQAKIRHCLALIIYNKQGQFLLEKRPPQGLLGGMTGFPLGEFHPEKPNLPPAQEYIANSHEWGGDYLPPFPLKNMRLAPLSIGHIFTHIKLTVYPLIAEYDASMPHFSNQEQLWLSWDEISEHPLPRLMQKIYEGIKPDAMR